MDWTNWKSWTLTGGAILALFTIYTFASPDATLKRETMKVNSAAQPDPRRPAGAPPAPQSGIPGVEPVHREWLDRQSGTFRSDRNLFTFVERPAPPPPVVVPAVPTLALPADTDKDGIPDFQDNCPGVANTDQIDIDRNGVGAACQQGVEQVPPPPERQLPPFEYKFLGTFGTARRPIATFSKDNEVVNVREGDVFGGGFILRKIGIESVDIGHKDFPAEKRTRIPIGQ